MNTNAYLGLSLLAIAAVAGAGVGIGSCVALIAIEANQPEEKESRKAAAHSPLEKHIGVFYGFAASTFRN